MIIAFNIGSSDLCNLQDFKTYKRFEALHADLAHTNRFMTQFYDKVATGLEKRIEEAEDKVENQYDEQCQHVEKRYWENWQCTEWRTNNADFQLTELGNDITKLENYEETTTYARRIHCG